MNGELVKERWRELCEERAAIMEEGAGFDREAAERLAVIDTLRAWF